MVLRPGRTQIADTGRQQARKFSNAMGFTFGGGVLTNSNYLTTGEAAALLAVSVPTAQQWVERGLLKSWKTDGGHRRILQDSVRELLQSQRQKAGLAHAPYVMPVLIVEDDAHLIQLYKDHMASWPFGTTTYVAPNGYEGLLLVGEVRPRLLICDLRLPGVNGFNVVRALCEIERFNGMGIVVISGLPVPEIDAHGGLPTRVEVMGKPVDFARLQSLAAKLWASGVNSD
jgi:excisionase family DNA binding protein